MWIRSQNNGLLVDITGVTIWVNKRSDGKSPNKIDWSYIHYAGTNIEYIDESSGFFVGRYKEYDRAIEVMNEIQNAIIRGETLFQMPEE